MNADAEVLVIGGGPIGLATAIACAHRGLAVRVLEARGADAAGALAEAPLDKACGEGLMPDGAAWLEGAGVAPAGAPLLGIVYRDGEHRVEGRFPGPAGLGVRRTTLHRHLRQRASTLGVELLRERALGLETSAGGWRVRTRNRLWRPRWLVAADGLRSPCRRWAGLEGPASGRRRFGVRRHYRLERGRPAPSLVEVHWDQGIEAYVTPVGDGIVGVALLFEAGATDARTSAASPPAAPFDRLLVRFPLLRQELGSAEAISRDLGMGPLRQRVRAVVRDNLALVGDAAGYVDAITGEGLSLGFHQAAALAAALAAGDLAGYARALRRLRRLPDLLTELCLLLSRKPGLRRRTFQAFARDPVLFERLLALHARQSRARAPVALRLLWGLATAGAAS